MISESGRHKGLKETTGDMFYFIEVEGIGKMQLHVVTNKAEAQKSIEIDEFKEKSQNCETLAHIEKSTENTLEAIESDIKDITEPVQFIKELTETGIASLEGHQDLLTVPHMEDINPTNNETVSRKFVEPLMEKSENENINSVSFSTIAMSVYVLNLLLFVYYQ